MKRTAARENRDPGTHDYVIDLLVACPDLNLRKYRAMDSRMRNEEWRENWIRRHNADVAFNNRHADPR